MARAPTTTDKEPQRDILPELDDDVDPVAAAASNETADVDDAPEADEAPERAETPREAAVRRYREIRDGKAKAAPDNDDEDAGDDPEPEAPAKAPNPSPAVAAAAKPVAPVATPPPVAAEPDPRLESILEELKALREERAAPRKADAVDDAADDEDQTPSAKAKPAIDTEKLGSIVERIQIGDKEEGSLALAELIELVSTGNKPDVDAEQIGRVVSDTIAQERSKSEIESATANFRGKYEAIVQDPDMLDLSLNRLSAELREDLVGLGMKPADVQRANPDQLMTMHTQARNRGLKVRGYSDLFDKVGTDMVAKYGAVIGSKPADPAPRPTSQPQPSPSTRIADRMDRKRSATVQPRTAGVRASTEPTQKPKSRADVLMEMRRSRGFSA